MNKKSYLLGVLTGIVVTFLGLFIIGLINQNSEDSEPIQFLEKPVSYEKKKKTSFKVIQVISNAAALAIEQEQFDDYFKLYIGNTVLIIGENFYSDQIITIKNPQRVGTYNYINKREMPMTVPVLKGEIIE